MVGENNMSPLSSPLAGFNDINLSHNTVTFFKIHQFIVQIISNLLTMKLNTHIQHNNYSRYSKSIHLTRFKGTLSIQMTKYSSLIKKSEENDTTNGNYTQRKIMLIE